MNRLYPHYIATMSEPLFFITDIVIFPLLVFIFTKMIKRQVEQNKSNIIYEKYFLRGWYIKVTYTILLALVYDFYYDGGDTVVYYNYVLILKRLILEDPIKLISILSNPEDFYNSRWLLENFWFDGGTFVFNHATKYVIIIGLLSGMFTGFSYLGISIVISFYAYIGCWRLYRTYHSIYPNLYKELAIACLFIPSVGFWGSGLMKDSVCIGSLGYLTYSVYQLLFKKKDIFINVIVIFLTVVILLSIKVYIILAYAPALAMWIFTRYRYNIKNPLIKALSMPLFFGIAAIVSVGVLSLMASYAEKYAFEEMVRTAKDTQNWLVTSSQMSGGSFYTLGDIDYTAKGMIKIFPNAVNVALFRPYLWEAKKPMLYFASVEGLITFFLTVRLLFKSGFINFFKLIASNPEVQFCLIFSIIFAFAVGFTSYNFGALARYKIPFMPFYYIALFILSDSQKKQQKELAKT